MWKCAATVASAVVLMWLVSLKGLLRLKAWFAGCWSWALVEIWEGECDRENKVEGCIPFLRVCYKRFKPWFSHPVFLGLFVHYEMFPPHLLWYLPFSTCHRILAFEKACARLSGFSALRTVNWVTAFSYLALFCYSDKN